LKTLSGKEFAKLLEQFGWKQARIKGSHHIYIKQNQSARISIPIHGNRPLKAGLQKHLMTVAGISEQDL